MSNNCDKVSSVEIILFGKSESKLLKLFKLLLL